MKLQVTHRTRYAYGAPVRDSFNEVRLQPADTTRQRRLAFRLSVQPTTRLSSRLDFYLNTVHTFEVPSPHAELVVDRLLNRYGVQVDVVRHRVALRLPSRRKSG